MAQKVDILGRASKTGYFEKWPEKWICKIILKTLCFRKWLESVSKFRFQRWFESVTKIVWSSLYLFCKILSGSLLLVLFVLELGLRMTWVSVVSSMFDLQMVNLSMSSDSLGILEWFLKDFGKIREGFLKKSSVLDLW